MAAERIFNEKGRLSENYTSVSETLKYLKKRRELELAHFSKNYKLNLEDNQQFDLVIDTTDLTPQEVCERILKKLKD